MVLSFVVVCFFIGDFCFFLWLVYFLILVNREVWFIEVCYFLVVILLNNILFEFVVCVYVLEGVFWFVIVISKLFIGLLFLF